MRGSFHGAILALDILWRIFVIVLLFFMNMHAFVLLQLLAS